MIRHSIKHLKMYTPNIDVSKNNEHRRHREHVHENPSTRNEKRN